MNEIKKNEWRINWNLGQDNINWKFWDLIKLCISLINQIKSLIEESIKFGDLIEPEISLINKIRV
jgi:hypothetical protein